MSKTKLENVTVVSSSICHLTKISSASVSTVSDCLISSMSLAQCTLQESHNVTENRLQMMERNISSLTKTFNRFIETQRTSKKQVKNEGRQSGGQSPIRHKCKTFYQSRSPYREHDVHCQCSESPLSFAASQSDIHNDSESDFVYYNPSAVTEIQG